MSVAVFFVNTSKILDNSVFVVWNPLVTDALRFWIDVVTSAMANCCDSANRIELLTMALASLLVFALDCSTKAEENEAVLVSSLEISSSMS